MASLCSEAEPEGTSFRVPPSWETPVAYPFMGLVDRIPVQPHGLSAPFHLAGEGRAGGVQSKCGTPPSLQG